MNAQQGKIASIGTASPEYTVSQSEVFSILEKQYSSSISKRSFEIMKKCFAHPSIQTRSFSVNTYEALVELSKEHLDTRMKRFTEWAVQLSEKAATDALAEVSLSPAEITCIIVNTCTGYICPGLSTYLIERMGLNPKFPISVTMKSLILL